MSMASDEQLSFPLDRLLLTYLEEMFVFQRNVALLGGRTFYRCLPMLPMSTDIYPCQPVLGPMSANRTRNNTAYYANLTSMQ